MRSTMITFFLATSTPAFAIDAVVLDATPSGATPLGDHLEATYAADPSLTFTHVEVGTGYDPADLALLSTADVILLNADFASMVDPTAVAAVIEGEWTFGIPLVTSARPATDRDFVLDDAIALPNPGTTGATFAGSAPAGLTLQRSGHPILDGVTVLDAPDYLEVPALSNSTVLATWTGTGVPAVTTSGSWFWFLGGYSVAINVPGLYGDDLRADGWDATSDGYTLLANTLDFVTTEQPPGLLVDGTCPGGMEVLALGMTPGAPLAVISGTTDIGYAMPLSVHDVVPGGPCTGQGLPFLAGTTVLRAMGTADASGNWSTIVPSTHPAVCDTFIAVVDLATCEASNVYSWATGI